MSLPHENRTGLPSENRTSPLHDNPPDNLLALMGWDDHFAQAAQAVAHDNAQLRDSLPGRIGRVDRGACVVFTQRGSLGAKSSSEISQDATAPVTGDWVLVSQESGVGWVIDSILPRRTELVRRDPAGGTAEQSIVSNVDVVGVVLGLDRKLVPAQLERLLVVAVNSGARPLVVLNKVDLVAGKNSRKRLAQLKGQVSDLAPEVEVVATCGLGKTRGLDLLEAQVGAGQTGAGQTLVFIGASGVGKSSLARALLLRQGGSEFAAATGFVPEVAGESEVADESGVAGESKSTAGTLASGRGQHTTVARDLLLLPRGGVLIDTPGLRAVGLWAADVALDEVFSDISERAQSCKFRDCTHRMEPECAVLEAVASGEIAADRLERYHRLWSEVADLGEKREERERLAQRGRHRQKTSQRVRRKRRR